MKHRFLSGSQAMGVLLLVTIAVSYSSAQSLGATAASSTGGYQKTVVLQDLPTQLPQSGNTFMPKRMPYTPQQYRILKESALRNAAASDLPKSQAPIIGTTPTAPLGVRFLPNVTLDEVSCGGFIPSDSALAVSPSYVVEVENACIKVFNPKTGALISGPTALGTFLGSNPLTGDPRALYDAIHARFIVIAEDFANNNLEVAVSATPNPASTWHIYRYAMGGPCNNGGDFPMLGQTTREEGDVYGGIYVDWNVFDCNGNFSFSSVRAIPKTPAYAGKPINTIFGFDGQSFGANLDTLQPANTLDNTARREFLVDSLNFNFGGGGCSTGCNQLIVWSFLGVPITGHGQSLTGTVLGTANTYFLSTHAPEPGCAINTCGPDTGFPHITGEVTYQHGTLFATLNNFEGIQIFEIEPFLNADGTINSSRMRSEICEGCGGFSDGGQAYYGTISPDPENNWTMVFNYSNPTNLFPGTAILGERVVQPPNTLADSGYFVALGQAFYFQLDQFGRNRWGDYTAVGQNGTAMWWASQFAEANGNWGKVVGDALYTSPTQP